MLTRMIVDVAFPLSMRIWMWMSEKHIDLRNPDEILKYMSPILSLEQAKAMAQYETLVDSDEKTRESNNEKFKTFINKIKLNLKNIIKLQKEIIIELKSTKEFFNNNFVAYVTPWIFEIWAKVTSHLVTKTEVISIASSYIPREVMNGPK